MFKFLNLLIVFIFYATAASSSCITTPYSQISSSCTKVHSNILGTTTWVFSEGHFRYKPLENGHSFKGRWSEGVPDVYGIYEVKEQYQYIGEINRGVIDGYGKLIENDGDSFVGTFKKGILSGLGTARYSNGSTYSGTLLNFEPNGKGEMLYSDGSSYSGDWLSGEYNGIGLYTTSNGDRYSGNFYNGTLFGVGRAEFADGAVYNGNFLKGLPFGKGEFYNVTSNLLESNWRVGLTGVFRLNYSSGEFYHGKLKNGIKHGVGILERQDGSTYHGNFENGEFSGKGVLKWDNFTLAADFKKGSVSGEAKGFDSSGNTYLGKLEGLELKSGRIEFTNGSVYEGGIARFKPHGVGSLTTDRQLVFGRFEQGKISGAAAVSTKADNNESLFEYPNVSIGFYENGSPDEGREFILVDRHKNKVTFCKPLINGKLKCLSNSLVERTNTFIRKYISSIPLREHLFEPFFGVPNLRTAFKKHSFNQNIGPYQAFYDKEWSLEVFLATATTAAMYGISLTDLNDPKVANMFFKKLTKCSENWQPILDCEI